MKIDSVISKTVDTGGNYSHGRAPDNIFQSELFDLQSALCDRIRALAPESQNDQSATYRSLSRN